MRTTRVRSGKGRDWAHPTKNGEYSRKRTGLSAGWLPEPGLNIVSPVDTGDLPWEEDTGPKMGKLRT